MLAVFEIALVPTAVDVPIVTGTVIALPLLPAAIAVDDVQLRLLAPIAPEHVQPVPLGTALNVRPVGSVSVTVIVAVVAPVPLLLGVIVYCAPLCPIVHGPLLVFVTATVGTPVIVVVLALLVAAEPEFVCTESPPP
jgi:hypothetical protein